MYHVYILYSPKLDRYYIGHTNDLNRRLEEHNARHTRSTRAGIPWELMYVQYFNTKKDAVLRENKIKSMKSRTYIEELIKHQ